MFLSDKAPTNAEVMWWQKTLFWLFLAQFCLIKALPQKHLEANGVTRIPGGTLIDCRQPHGSYFPDPEDCRHFYHCSDWSGLQKKSCGSHLYFNAQTGVCDWPSVVRRMRPECPDPNALEEHESPRAHQPIVPGKAGTLTKVQFPKTTSSTGPESVEPATTPTPVPRRARPSVGVPARFPDQQPVVLFDPSEFIRPAKPAQQSVPRFQPQIDSITAPGFQPPSSTVNLNRFQPQPIFNPGSPFQQFPGFGQIPQSSTPQRAIPPVPQPSQNGQFAFQPTGTIEAVRDLNQAPVNAVPARSRQPIRTTTDQPTGIF